MTVELEEQLEADDGIVEVQRVMPYLDFPWAALPPGPRRWAPTDLSVEVEGNELTMVRLAYRTVGDRVVVVAGARPAHELDWLVERLSTPLLFAHYRKVHAGMAPEAIMAAVEGAVVWDDHPEKNGWRFGQCGVGSRPVRLAHLASPEGHLVVAAHGVAEEEVTTLVAGLVPLTPGSEEADDLHARHRRALAQRWWDAPRAPWRPQDAEDGDDEAF